MLYGCDIPAPEVSVNTGSQPPSIYSPSHPPDRETFFNAVGSLIRNVEGRGEWLDDDEGARVWEVADLLYVLQTPYAHVKIARALNQIASRDPRLLWTPPSTHAHGEEAN